MICPNCHNNNRDGAKYCDECGFPLSGVIAENAQKASELLNSADDDSNEARYENADAADMALSDALKTAQESQSSDGENASGDEATSPLTPVVLSSDGKKLISADQATASLNDLPLIDSDEGKEGPADETPENESADDADEGDVDERADASSAESPEDATEVLSAAAAGLSASKRQELDPDITTNLSGLDVEATEIIGERLADFDYDAYKPTWRDGQTMEMPAIESDKPVKERAFLESSSVKQKGRGKRIALIVAAVVLAICATVAGVTYYLEIWGGKTVPDVTNLTQQEATDILEQSGFVVRATQVRSDGAEGLVLIEDPVGNSRQAEGSEVVIHISVPRHIPNIVGLTQDEAQTLMDEEGLTNVTIEQQRSDEQEGKVLSVSPDQGTQVRSNQTVVVKVAVPFKVPEVTNMSLSEVESAIEEAGLTYGIYYTYTEDYPDYTVLGVWPEAGTVVPGGSTVTINVSKARATQLISATQSLLAAGSTITIGGVNYAISSLDAVNYIGGNQTSYTITAAPYITLLGESLFGTARSVSGTITWNDDDTVASIS